MDWDDAEGNARRRLAGLQHEKLRQVGQGTVPDMEIRSELCKGWSQWVKPGLDAGVASMRLSTPLLFLSLHASEQHHHHDMT